eukprot:scaffold106242_cov63-Phaeocystis_antarctica.AAC.9
MFAGGRPGHPRIWLGGQWRCFSLSEPIDPIHHALGHAGRALHHADHFVGVVPEPHAETHQDDAPRGRHQQCEDVAQAEEAREDGRDRPQQDEGDDGHHEDNVPRHLGARALAGQREAARAGAPAGRILRLLLSIAVDHLVDATHNLAEVRRQQQDAHRVQRHPQVEQEAWRVRRGGGIGDDGAVPGYCRSLASASTRRGLSSRAWRAALSKGGHSDHAGRREKKKGSIGLTGHSSVGPTLTKCIMITRVEAWCTGRGGGEEAGRRGGGEVVWWGCVAGSGVERRERGGSHEVERDHGHGRALVLGRGVSVLLGEEQLAPPLLGEHPEGAQLLHRVPHVVRVEDHRQYLQQPVGDDERLGVQQRIRLRRHPRHRRVVGEDQVLQSEVVACAHHADRQVGRAREVVAVEGRRLSALEEDA